MLARRASHYEAIEAAKQLFWQKGYSDTSMAELVSATGMNRYALYSVFGSKREIFLATLDAYFEEARAHYEPLMRDTYMPPLERIRRGLETYAGATEEELNGCLVCHVAAEQGRDDPQIAAAVLGYFAKIREVMKIPLAEAEEAGELNPNLTSEVAAQVVFDAKMSIGAHARAGADQETISRIPAATLAALSAPPRDA